MKNHEREFIEEEVKLPFEQVAALITTIRILAEDDEESVNDRRIRLTYLLDDLTQTVKERFDKFIDSLYYNGGENEQEKRSKEICDFRKNRTVIELMREYGLNTRHINKTPEDLCCLRDEFVGRASEDFTLLQKLFGIENIGYSNGEVTADKGGITYSLDIDDENQTELGAGPRHFIGGNENENHA